MVNILVPTDLSDLSKIALQYAIKLADKMEANITLLHVINFIEPTMATMRTRAKSLEKELVGTATEDLDKMLKEALKITNSTVPITTRVVTGPTFSETLNKEAKKLRTGLIVMGTRGASGVKKYVMGSNTASVIEGSKVPVLAVPELGTFKSLRNVVYASDLKHLEKELKTLIPYLEKFQSTIHLIHVAQSLKTVSALEKKIDAVVQKAGYKNVVIRVMVNKNIDEAIGHYVEVTKADLLTMFTHDPTFYEKLFDRSMTRKMAFHGKVPLLAFKQR